MQKPLATSLWRAGVLALLVCSMLSGVVTFDRSAGATTQVAADGGVAAWGANVDGQVGDGTNLNRLLPVAVVGLGSGSGVRSVAGGGFHSLALKSDGTVLSWGNNHYGQLGDGTTTGRKEPGIVPALGPGSGVIAVTAGYMHSLALKSDGSVLSWGQNDYGQLGTGSPQGVSQLTPRTVSGLGPGSGAIAISVGDDHNLVLKSNGSVMAWGKNYDGAVGNGVPGHVPEPVTVSGLGPGSGATAVATGKNHSFALANGAVLAWGYNNSGQLGVDSTTSRFTPGAVAGLGAGSGVTAVVGGGDHSLALMGSGAVLTWGANWSGQLGNGSTERRLVPSAVPALGAGSGVTGLSSDLDHSLAVKSDGTVLAWGANYDGQLGNGDRQNRLTPQGVFGFGAGSGVTAVAAGRGHSLVLGNQTPPPALPAAPSNPAAVAIGSTSIRVTWEDKSFNEDGFEINNGSESRVAAANSTSLVWSGLAPGTRMCFKVRAFNTAGSSPYVPAVSPSSVCATTPTPQVGADLTVTKSGPTSASVDVAITYTVQVVNHGPETASGVLLVDVLRVNGSEVGGAFGAAVVSPSSQGACNVVSGRLVCDLHAMANGASASVAVTVTPPAAGTMTNSASVDSANDSVPGDNESTVVTSVSARRTARADVNGDGRDDLLWYEGPDGDHMSVIGGAVDGSLGSFHTRRQLGAPVWAGVGDVNGDGRADLLWYESNGDLSVIGGAADGALTGTHTRRQLGAPVWAGVGDVNGDGRADLLWYESNGDLSVIGGAADGALTGTHTRRQLGPPVWAGVGDVNGDGRADLLWYESNGDLSVIGGAADGALTGTHTRRQLGPPVWAGVGDVNGDGRADLLWYESNGDLSVIGGAADGALTGTHTRRQLGPPVWAGVGDVNGDGRTDLLWYEGPAGDNMSAIGGTADGTFGQFHTRRQLGRPTWAGPGSFPGTNGSGVARRPGATTGDYDNDGDTDIGVFRPSNGVWFIRGGLTVGWGTSGDVPVPGDYDGDGDTDIAVFRPSNGVWFIRDGLTVAWGTAGDIPVPGDYDGDGDTDMAVFRPSTGTWFIRGGLTVGWGTSGDIPEPGDYDGDGDTDVAVFRPSTGTWFVRGGVTVGWGTSGDVPVPGDYDKDGDTDFAVFRPSNGVWFVRGGLTAGWGTSGDVPVTGDYDGDGDSDVAVFRPSNGVWFVRDGTTTAWGTSGDVPVSGYRPLP